MNDSEMHPYEAWLKAHRYRLAGGLGCRKMLDEVKNVSLANIGPELILLGYCKFIIVSEGWHRADDAASGQLFGEIKV